MEGREKEGKMMGGGGGGQFRRDPAPFLMKTFELVEDPSTDEVISWNETGNAFVVWKSAEFSRDLLPKFFKHNNFSSFVRQLNTYGFRKVVPDKWEFANDFFKRGEKELLSEIHRRKAITSVVPAQVLVGTVSAATTNLIKSNGVDSSSLSNSGGDDSGSTSTDPKIHMAEDKIISRLASLSGENERLKEDNKILSSELARIKEQCEGLVALLSKSKNINVTPAQIFEQMFGAPGDDPPAEMSHSGNTADDDDDDDEKVDEGLKLFGVWVQVNKKRTRDECNGCGAILKKMKTMLAMMGCQPWMKKMCSPSAMSNDNSSNTTTTTITTTTTSKVCI